MGAGIEVCYLSKEGAGAHPHSVRKTYAAILLTAISRSYYEQTTAPGTGIDFRIVEKTAVI